MANTVVVLDYKSNSSLTDVCSANIGCADGTSERSSVKVILKNADYEVVSFPGFKLQFELNLFDGELRYFDTLVEAVQFANDFFSYQSFDVYD